MMEQEQPRTYVTTVLAAEAMAYRGTAESAQAIEDWAGVSCGSNQWALTLRLAPGTRLEVRAGWFLVRDEDDEFTVYSPESFEHRFRALEDVPA